MRKFFGMPRGEFVGTASLIAVILAVLLFNLFYVRTPEPQPDLSAFAGQIAAFEARQAAYADSVAAARAQRDSAYSARQQTHSNRYPRYEKRSSFYESSYYQKDTSTLKPLKKRQDYLVEKVELNHCDTADITRIPQFGSKRA